MAVSMSSGAGCSAQWPGTGGGGQLALAGGGYYCPVAPDTLMPAGTAAQVSMFCVLLCSLAII